MLKYLNIILILIISEISFAQEDIIKKTKDYIGTSVSDILFISISYQKLYHIQNEKIIYTYVISSSVALAYIDDPSCMVLPAANV